MSIRFCVRHTEEERSNQKEGERRGLAATYLEPGENGWTREVPEGERVTSALRILNGVGLISG